MPDDFLIGAAIGSGNTALAAERGGADFLLAISAGRLRNMGAPSIACMLPIFNARDLSEPFAREELISQCSIPILLGLNVWEYSFAPRTVAHEIKEAGFSGAVNFPSCMHFSRPMQQILARAGRGIEQEVEQLRAVQDQGLTSMFYCATRTQARLAADVGLDAVCLNLGWNVGGVMGHQSRTSVEEVANAVREIGRLIKRISPKTKFLIEGGPIATAEDLRKLMQLAPIDGYVGGSTIERMPMEVSVADQINRFRDASRNSLTLDAADNALIRWSAGFGFLGEADALLSFLRRLKALAEGNKPIALLVERGTPSMPAIEAILGAASALNASIQIDVAGEDYPERARNILFGHRDTIAGRKPALADRDARHLIIRSSERLSIATQRRLARAIHDGGFRAPVTRRTLPVAPRVILVTEVASQEGKEREALLGAGMAPELVDSMAGRFLRMPPLRERIDDLTAIVAAHSEMNGRSTQTKTTFTRAAIQRMQAYPWPGNEQEVHALLGSLLASSETAAFDVDAIKPSLGQEADSTSDRRTEKDRIVDALWRHGFNRTQTADALGISRKTLYNKIKKYGLDR